MIARRGNAAAVEHFADLLHLFARGAIDNAGLPLPLLQQLQKLRFLAFRMENREEQIRAVKARRDNKRVLQSQKSDDILTHLCSRSRGERADDRTARQTADESADVQIAFAEILTPLRHAMRLVHGDHGDIRSLRKRDERLRLQPLWRDVDDLIHALRGVAQRLAVLRRVQRLIQIRGVNALLDQCADLILHQRDQRRDNERDTDLHQRGHLIAHRLSRAGRHDPYDVASGQKTVNQLLLSGTEGIIAEIRFQYIKFIPLLTQHNRSPPYLANVCLMNSLYHFIVK